MKKLFPALLRLSVCALISLSVAGALNAAEFYAAPNASANGTGSLSNPWQLQTALSQPSTVIKPGDTLWLRGGTYTGRFTSYLNGTSAEPIIVRQYAGERATIDGGTGGTTAIFTVYGSYTWFWGFEVTSSDPDRSTSTSGSSPPDITRGDGFEINQTVTHPGLKFINLIVHDTRQGFSYWKEAQDAEIYGSLIYYNGWNAPDGGHGHGIYAQNQTGTKKVTDSIIFSGFSYGFHAYTEGSHIDNLDLEGNTLFNAGNLDGTNRNLLIGGIPGINAANPVVKNNYMYRQGGADGFNIGLDGSCSNATVTNNYVSNETTLNNCLPVTMTGNSFYGGIAGFSQSQYPSNTYYSSRPTGVTVFIRSNAYEAGRANVTVYNWANQSSVSVDLTGILAPGTGFEIRNAHDFFGAPVLTGTYSGGSVSIPMTGLSVAAPVGWGAPNTTSPEFGAFVVLPVTGAPNPTPSPTPTHTPTPGPSTPTPTPTPTRTPTPVGVIPAPWVQQDIGSVGIPGGATDAAGTFTVTASGVDIEGTSDEFHYVYQPLSGDATVVAKVSSIVETDPWAKGGVMIRESTSASSKQAMIVLTPENGVAFQRRGSTGGDTTTTLGAQVASPYWVKLVRSGDTFTAYSSPDGSSWTQVGSDTIDMATNVLVGLALTSHNDGVLCTAVFAGVSVTSGGPAPTPTPTPTPGGSFVIRYGAEAMNLTDPMITATDAGAFGSQFVETYSANEGTAVWSFSVPTSGTYYVWGRVRGVDPQHDSFFVKMDSGPEDIYDIAPGTSSPDWQWTRLNGRGGTDTPLTIDPRTFSLSAGSHTLTFRGREPYSGLDRVLLTDDGSFVPTEAP